MCRDDVYPVKMSRVGSLLHYVVAYLGLNRLRHSAAGNRPQTSLLDIHHPNPWHTPVAASTVVNTPDDGRRKRPKHVE
jgi:hypothetical protein